MAVALRLNWESVGRKACGVNPWLNIYQTDIGRDENGTLWMCRAEYRPERKKFMVTFDNELVYKDTKTKFKDDDYEDAGHWSDPFSRTEVIYAYSYWKAHEKWYSTKYCDYEQIQQFIREFIISRKLIAYDVTGKLVQ